MLSSLESKYQASQQTLHKVNSQLEDQQTNLSAIIQLNCQKKIEGSQVVVQGL